MTKSRAWSALAVLLLAGCGEDVNCLQGIFAAVSVHALSAAEAAPLLGVRGVVSDGTYRDSLVEVGQGYYEGASGRAGMYTVHLELPPATRHGTLLEFSWSRARALAHG